MKLWVDVLRFIKRGATGGAFGFFTYMELSQIFNFYRCAPSDGFCSDLVTWVPFVEARSIAMVVLHYERLGCARQDVNRARSSERSFHIVDVS